MNAQLSYAYCILICEEVTPKQESSTEFMIYGWKVFVLQHLVKEFSWVVCLCFSLGSRALCPLPTNCSDTTFPVYNSQLGKNKLLWWLSLRVLSLISVNYEEIIAGPDFWLFLSRINHLCCKNCRRWKNLDEGAISSLDCGSSDRGFG